MLYKTIRLIKKNERRNNVLLFMLLLILVFLSRLPFLNAGYGSDPDAWRVAYAARTIATTGHYSASRLPGFPVQEIMCSFLWTFGPLALNAMTALFSFLAAAFFALAIRSLGGKDYILASMTFAFTPVIYINSTNSMDYIWALAFILGALYFILVQRPIIAGVLLGIAIGCRITSGAMIIPLGFLLLQREQGKFNFRELIKFSLAACIIGALAFMPVFLTYGRGFFTFYEAGYPPLTSVIKKATIDLWGTTGLIGICIAFISIIFSLVRSRSNNSISKKSVTSPHVAIWLLAIFLYIVAFLRLPMDAGYLIPVIPFVILLFAQLLNRKVFVVVCIIIISSSFISIGWEGIQHGMIFAEQIKRVRGMEYVERILAAASTLGEEKNVIVTGAFWSQIQGAKSLQRFKKYRKQTEFVDRLDRSQLEKYRKNSFKVYYIPSQRYRTFRIYGLDLHESGATPLFVE